MPRDTTSEIPRSAVVDLGSNSVRLVVFEGRRRNPLTIFNEKAVLRLGRGLNATGRLNEEGVAQALTVMGRYHAIARAMRADPFEVLATAAVRDASNGPAFVRELEARMPGAAIRILSGEQEAELAAEGVLCGIPTADGILADIGGGSLEVVRLAGGARRQARTLPLGVIRLAERAAHDVARAREIAAEDLRHVEWLAEGAGRELYLVGGAFRALAHVHMGEVGYPLSIVHHYTIAAEEARELASLGTGKRALDKLPNVPRRRAEDLPYAGASLRLLLRATGVRRVVFSANGLREGWFMRHMPPEVQAEDPLLAAARELAGTLARDPALPPVLLAWTAPLFPDELPQARRLREAACWYSDIGSHDHPEYRAEQAYLRVLRQPGIALSHTDRAFLARVLALRYDAEPGAAFLSPARSLLDAASVRLADQIGLALRLAYTLSAGTPALLGAASLAREDGQLVLRLREGSGVFAGESVTRRLKRLAEALGLPSATVSG